MAIMMRLDNRGHGELARWNQGDRVAQEQAAMIFAEHQKKHYTMFDITNKGDNNEPGEVMKTFDPAVEEILAVPRMKAG